MRVFKALSLLVFLGLTITGIHLTIAYSSNSPYVIYSGDVTFDTTKEYITFKEYLMRSDIIIKEIQILASDPPIWIRYSVEVPRHWKFPFAYDYMGVLTFGIGVAFNLIVASGLVGTVITAGWILCGDDNEKEVL